MMDKQKKILNQFESITNDLEAQAKESIQKTGKAEIEQDTREPSGKSENALEEGKLAELRRELQLSVRALLYHIDYRRLHSELNKVLPVVGTFEDWL